MKNNTYEILFKRLSEMFQSKGEVNVNEERID